MERNFQKYIAKNIINKNHPDTVREWYFIPSGISPWSLFRNSILFGSISGWHQQTQRSGEVKKVIRCTWKRLSAETSDTVKLAGNFAWFAAERLTFSCFDPTLILCSFSLLPFCWLLKSLHLTFWLRTLTAMNSQHVSLQTHGFPKRLKINVLQVTFVILWPHTLSHTKYKLLPGRLSKCVSENRWICFYLSRTRGP